MHILRTGGKYAREQQRLYVIKAVASTLTGAIVLILFSHVWILSLIFFGFGLHYLRRRSHWRKGILGEKMVVEALTPLDNSYVLMNDIVLPEKIGNIDHILVAHNGVFAIETKSYQWYYLNRFPIRQTIRNAISLRQFLEKQLKIDMFIPAILVSTHPDAVSRQNPSTVNVISLNNLCEFIKGWKNQSGLNSKAQKNLIHEILKISHAKSQENAIVKKWLFKYLGGLVAGLIVYLFYVLSGGDPYGKWVLVTQVVDGDTIHVGRGWRNTTVRLLGVDTPETVHPDKPVEFFGPEASEFTKKSLKGKKVHLEFEHLNQMDKYGRLLAYVYLSDGTLFNAELVKRGYARVIAQFHFRYYDEFHNYEREAMESGMGIWAAKVKNIQLPSEKGGKIIGNKKSKIYHLPGQAKHGEAKEGNQEYFDSAEGAIRAGYRQAKR